MPKWENINGSYNSYSQHIVLLWQLDERGSACKIIYPYCADEHLILIQNAYLDKRSPSQKYDSICENSCFNVIYES